MGVYAELFPCVRRTLKKTKLKNMDGNKNKIIVFFIIVFTSQWGHDEAEGVMRVFDDV